MFVYKLRTDNVQDDEGNTHTVYGIDVFLRIRSVPDIFTDRRRAKHLAKQCNRHQPALMHLKDVIDDAIAE